MTNGDRTTIWYTPSELDSLRPNCHVIRKSSSSFNCTPDYCTRGLEFYATKGTYLRQRDCKLAKFAVADEQHMQRRQYGKIDDDNALATAYGQRTQHCQEEAHIMALVDELFVRRHVYNLVCPPKLLDAQRTVAFSDKMRLCTCCSGRVGRGGRKASASLSLSPRPRRNCTNKITLSSLASHPKSRSESCLVTRSTNKGTQKNCNKKSFLQRLVSVASSNKALP